VVCCREAVGGDEATQLLHRERPHVCAGAPYTTLEALEHPGLPQCGDASAVREQGAGGLAGGGADLVRFVGGEAGENGSDLGGAGQSARVEAKFFLDEVERLS